MYPPIPDIRVQAICPKCSARFTGFTRPEAELEYLAHFEIDHPVAA